MPNTEGARAATRHLIERGCRRILMIEGRLGLDVDMSSLRVRGYRQALAEAGLPHDPELVHSLEVLSMHTGRDRIRELVDAGVAFDGVFCITDTVAIGALRGLGEAGIRVPEEVRVIGFDNIDEGEFLTPSLSSVDPDHDLMARTALDLLVRRMAGVGPDEPREEFVSTFRIVARESTESAAPSGRRGVSRPRRGSTTDKANSRRSRQA
jgi:DNA-binding LacI/PurR family transcriptional regulator